MSMLVPDFESVLLNSSSISSSGEVRLRCCVGRRTAMEPPWLMRVEWPLHIFIVEIRRLVADRSQER